MIEKKSNGVLEVTFADGSSLQTDLVLCATGRKPNVQDLGLENLEINCRENGAIIVDETVSKLSAEYFCIGRCN